MYNAISNNFKLKGVFMDSSFELLQSDQGDLNSSFTAIEAPGKPDEETMAGWITDAQNKLQQNLRDSTQALQSLRYYQGFRVPSDYEYNDVFALLGKLASDDSSYEVSHHDRNLGVLKLVGIDDERIRHLNKAGVLYYAAIVSSAITSTSITKDYTEWLATATEVDEQLSIQNENNIARQKLYNSLKKILEEDIDKKIKDDNNNLNLINRHGHEIASKSKLDLLENVFSMFMVLIIVGVMLATFIPFFCGALPLFDCFIIFCAFFLSMLLLFKDYPGFLKDYPGSEVTDDLDLNPPSLF